MNKGYRWESETLHFDGDEFYRALIKEMDGARKSIDMEVYTFEEGVLAARLLDCFERATKRGVTVRLICDHWGSPLLGEGLAPRMEAAGVRVHLYRSLPWRPLLLWKRKNRGPFLQQLGFFWRSLTRLNRGFHRKVTIVDGDSAWVSSFNVTDVHLREVHNDNAWRDIGVRLQGPEVLLFCQAFERTFFRRRTPRDRNLEQHDLVHLNDSFWMRRKMNYALKRRIRNARSRIWIQNPYFLPERGLMRALYRQAKRGIDVRVMIPEKNDQEVIRWMNYGILVKLLKSGASVWQFHPAFAHKKVLLVDDQISVGSTNLNHRSFLHDLEVEVMLSHDDSHRAVENSFIEDQTHSSLLLLTDLERKPLWFRTLSRILFFFRYWC
jgi:cardiolipin synthase